MSTTSTSSPRRSTSPRAKFARALLSALVGVAAVSGTTVRAHDTKTHCRLTSDALKRSQRFPEVVVELEFDEHRHRADYVRAAITASPAIGALRRDAYGLVMAGSVLEDGQMVVNGSVCSPLPCADLPAEFSRARVLNHFQDLSGGALGYLLGLALFNNNARDWAFDDPDNQFNWRAAVDWFRESILLEDPAARVESEERMLVALGCNLHLLQDLTSPAHARDDPHPGHHLYGIPGLVQGGSLMESREGAYVNMRRNVFPTANVVPVVKLRHANYFDSVVLDTATHFFSDDTIDRGIPLPANWDLSTSGTCEPILGVATEHYLRSSDAFHGIRNRLARRRALPWINGPSVVPARNTLSGSACDPSGGMDSVILDNLSHLVPSAVAYSAGLVDHFFRGKLTLAQSPNGELIVTNSSYQPAGLFPDLTFAADPQSSTPFELVVAQQWSDGRREVIARKTLTALPLDGSTSIPAIDAALQAGGSDRLWVCLTGALIGFDPGGAAGSLTWVRCSSVCSPDAQQATPAGDANADGGADIAIYHPFDPGAPFPQAGALRMHSGSACGELWSRFGSAEGQFFGARAVAIGRWNNDAHDDLLVQERLDSVAMQYRMAVLSGATGATLATFTWPTTLNGELQPLGKVDNDTVGDVGVAGSPYRVVSGRTGAVLRSCTAVQQGFTASVGVDWNHDGVPEVLVERPDGSFFLLDPRNCAVLYQSTAASAAYSGFRNFIGLEDFDDDGFPDFAGIEVFTSGSPNDPRDVALFSGRFGTPVAVLGEAAVQLRPSGNFDGQPGGEFCTRTVLTDAQGGFAGWDVRIWSARDALPVASLFVSEFVSSAPRVLGDRNGDGATDLYYGTSDSSTQSNCTHFVMGRP